MAKNKLFKIIISVLIIAVLFIFFSQTVSAIGVGTALNKFENQEIVKDNSEATNKIANMISVVINVIQVVGAGVAILMLVVLGIKWMGESPSGKAQIAKSAKYYVLGAILIFTAVGLLQIVKSFTDESLMNQSKWS